MIVVLPAYTRTYIHIYKHTYIQTYIHTNIHTYIQTYTHTNIHTYIPTYIYTYKHTYIHMYKHTHIHIYKHTYIHTNIHTYVRTVEPSLTDTRLMRTCCSFPAATYTNAFKIYPFNTDNGHFFLSQIPISIQSVPG